MSDQEKTPKQEETVPETTDSKQPPALPVREFPRTTTAAAEGRRHFLSRNDLPVRRS